MRAELPALEWIAGDLRVDARRIHDELGWRPVGPALPDDIARGSYRAA
jgi:hypothetical protein